MAKSTRDLMKRQMAHAYGNLSRAIDHLAEVESKFSGVHDKYAEHLQVMIVTLDMMRDGIKTFWKQAWGTIPADFEKFRNVRRRKHEG